jgi:hypothetical protein
MLENGKLSIAVQMLTIIRTVKVIGLPEILKPFIGKVNTTDNFNTEILIKRLQI